jgi:hypothetical protein
MDPARAVLRAPGPAALAEGLSAPTPNRVTGALRAAGSGPPAAALAKAVGVSRITACRCPVRLVESGRAGRRPLRPGAPAGTGVPLGAVYRWVKLRR